MEIFVKNRKFCQKSKCFPKIDIFVKNLNVFEKSNFLSKIEMFFFGISFENIEFREKEKYYFRALRNKKNIFDILEKNI